MITLTDTNTRAFFAALASQKDLDNSDGLTIFEPKEQRGIIVLVVTPERENWRELARELVKSHALKELHATGNIFFHVPIRGNRKESIDAETLVTVAEVSATPLPTVVWYEHNAIEIDKSEFAIIPEGKRPNLYGYIRVPQLSAEAQSVQENLRQEFFVNISEVTLTKGYPLTHVMGAQQWQEILATHLAPIFSFKPQVSPVAEDLITCLASDIQNDQFASENILNYLNDSGLRSAYVMGTLLNTRLQTSLEQLKQLIVTNPFEKNSYQRSFADFQDVVLRQMRDLTHKHEVHSEIVKYTLLQYRKEFLYYLILACVTGVALFIGICSVVIFA
jgi:hypothetical protein